MIRYLVPGRETMLPIRLYLGGAGRPFRGRLVPMTYSAMARRITPQGQLWWRALQSSARLRQLARHRLSPVTAQALQDSRSRLEATYRRLARRLLREGTYIFAATDQLTPADTNVAAAVWQALADSGRPVRLLNHPSRSLRRYELLRTLYERGVNRFNVYRLTEVRMPERYPVFLREESVHGGWKSGLLRNRQELDAALDALDRSGRSREGTLLVEFCDTADTGGLYRRYTAFIVGDRIFPKNMRFSRHWVLNDADLETADSVREEREYVFGNPHREQLRELFRLARIEYGRLDYGLLDGHIQVWEINTNSMVAEEAGGPRREVCEHVARELAAAFEAIAEPT
jgi:hypothetical protein